MAIQVLRQKEPSPAWWSRCMTAISHSWTEEVPERISVARSRSGFTASAVARIFSSLSHAVVTMHSPEVRSTIMDRPMQPSMAVTAGSTSSRTWAMPWSMALFCALTVVERAYTVHSLCSGRRPGDATGAAHDSPESPRLAMTRRCRSRRAHRTEKPERDEAGTADTITGSV